MISMGEVAFDQYIASRGGRHPDGSPAPLWAALGNDIRDAWEDAAEAAIDAHTSKGAEGGEGKFRF